MFPQVRKLNDESGVVLFVVLMVSIIIMILSVGILTQSFNENNYAQQQIDQITSDQLAKGIFWNAYSKAFQSGNMTSMQNIPTASVVIPGGRSYQVELRANPSGSYNVTANYDTFN